VRLAAARRCDLHNPVFLGAMMALHNAAMISHSLNRAWRPGCPSASTSTAFSNSLEGSTLCRNRALLKLDVLNTVQDESLVGRGDGERFLSRGGHDAGEEGEVGCSGVVWVQKSWTKRGVERKAETRQAGRLRQEGRERISRAPNSSPCEVPSAGRFEILEQSAAVAGFCTIANQTV